jgi:hypothetical protein
VPVGTKTPTGTGGKGPGPFEVNATIDRLLDVANYNVKKIPQNKNASAATLLHEQAVLTKKLQAGDPRIRLEEAAHIIAGRFRLEVDPARLPADVREGLKQYVNPAIPPNLVTPRVMHEGFAQWMIRRAEGYGSHGTTQMQAAGRYGEQFIQQAGLGEALDRVGDTFRSWAGQSPAQRYAGTISPTGTPAQPVGLTGREKATAAASSVFHVLQERLENNLAVLGRLYSDALQKGMAPQEANRRAMDTALALRWQSQNWAKDWAAHGYPEVQRDGSWKPGSKGYADVVKLLQPGEEEAYSAYAKARETVTDYQLEELRAQQQRKLPFQKPEPRTVTKEQHDEAQQVLADLRKHPDQYQRFEQVNQDRIAVSNAGLRFLGQIGYFRPEWVEGQIQKHTAYVSRERVFDQMTEDFLSQRGGSINAGGRQPAFTRARGQSGEQTRPALDTFAERFSDVAALAQKHLMDQPVVQLLRQPGMGEWAREMLERRHDPASADPTRMLPAEPDDPTKPIWRTRVDGRPVRFMVKDKALWDYLSNRQGEDKASVQIANWLARVPILSLAPKAIRLGATAASPVWHLRNLLPTRDPKTFLQNTMNVQSVKDLPSWYAGWAHFLIRGALSEGSAAKPYVELYERLAGDSHRWVAQDNPGEAFEGFPAFAKEVLRRLSYPELVPRALELKNQLDRFGINAQTVERWNKTGEMPPIAQQVALLNAAAEVTHNYQRRGTDINAWNKSIPFLAAHVANTSKWVRNWKANPQQAAMGLGILMAMRFAYWAWRKDDQDYQEQSVGSRNDFLIPTPIGSIKIAGPRGLDVPIGALADETLRWASRSNLHFERAASAAFEQVTPGLPEPYSTAGSLAGNRDRMMGWGGRPIIPRADEGAGAGYNALHHQLPFVAERLTGGALSGRTLPTLATAGLYAPGTPHQSVTDYFDRLHALEGQRLAARRQGQPFAGEAEYQRLHGAAPTMQQLSKQLRSFPSRDREAELRARQIDLARRVLGR